MKDIKYVSLLLTLFSAGIKALDILDEDGSPGVRMAPEDTPHEMQMYFHGGTSETVLFQKWMIMTWQEMLAACVGLALTAVGYEALKAARQAVFARHQPQTPTQKLRESYQMGYGAFDSTDASSTAASDTTFLDMGDLGKGDCCTLAKHPMCSGWNWLQSLMYMVQVFIGYLLMLAIMTYNAYICLAAVVGAGLGHLFFAWISATVHTDQLHCH